MYSKGGKGKKIHRRGPSVFHRNTRRIALLKGLGLISAAAAITIMGFFTAKLVTETPKTGPTTSTNNSGSKTSPSSAAPQPTQRPSDTAAGLRAFYLPVSLLENSGNLLNSAAGAGFNAVIFDLKGADGVLHYKSDTELAKNSGAVAENALTVQQMRSLKKEIEDKGFVAIPRLFAFRDPLSPSGLPSAKITLESYPSYTWLDNSREKGGKPWLNPYAPDAHRYITELAAELKDMGFSNIMLDGVQFPDQTAHAYYGKWELTSLSKSEVLKKFVGDLQNAVGGNCRVIHTMPGLSVFGDVTKQFGGNPATFGADIVAPMLLPSALGNRIKVGETTITDPSSSPSETVELSSEQIKLRLELIDSAQRPSVMPWLQAFDYTSAQISSQINAVKKVFGKDASFILYNQNGNYDFDALK